MKVIEFVLITFMIVLGLGLVAAYAAEQKQFLALMWAFAVAVNASTVTLKAVAFLEERR